MKLRSLILAGAIWATGLGIAQDGAKHSPPMTVSDVARMAKAGVSDDVILAQIHARRATFDLKTDDLVNLKSAGVSDRVIREMMAAAPARTPAAAVPPKAAAAAPTAIAAIASVRWITHEDPAGFSLNLPASWTVRADRQQGRVLVEGTERQQAVIWPGFIEKQQLDARGATALLLQLARRVDSSMAWGAPEKAGEGMRTFARGERNGVAFLRWTVSPEGTQILLFCVTAPQTVYRQSMDVLAGVLKSFHTIADPAAKTAAAKPAAPKPTPVAWVSWTDPREGALHASVPQGWNVSGGVFRQSATDVRKNVVLLAPDGQIRISVGDANVGIYATPNATYSRFGVRSTNLGDGTRLEVRPFEQARQFLDGYVTRSVARECPGARVVSGAEDRSDLASLASERAREQGGRSPTRVTAASVSLSCSWNGQEAHGYYAASTVLVTSQMASLWYVDSLYGYVAAAARQQDAEGITRHVFASMQVNAAWRQREDQIAANAVAEDNRRAQELQAQARESIARDEQQTSDMIVKGYQQRSQVYDEINRRRENAILGTVDVIDPNTGRQFKVDNYGDYHWMNNQGVVAGTRTDSSPGMDWHEMITLP
jgi:hypothetical protein